MPQPDLNLSFLIVLLSVGLIVIYSLMGKRKDLPIADQMLSQAHDEKRTGNVENAEYLLRRAQKIYESAGVPDVTKYSSCMVKLAECYTERGKFDEARQSCRNMLNVWQRIIDRREQDRMIDIDYFAATASFGSGTPDVVEFYLKVIDLKKQMFGASHSEVINSMLLYSRLLTQAGARAEAEQIAAEAQAMRDNPEQRAAPKDEDVV